MSAMSAMDAIEREAIKSNIARVISDIYSARGEYTINYRFVPKDSLRRENA